MLMEKAIDIHAHYGDPECFPQKGLEKEFLTLSPEQLKAIYDRCDICAGCFSPMEALFPANAEMLCAANACTAETAEKHSWFYQWAVVNPLYPASYRQAEELLKQPKCVGVKIHPDANDYNLEDYADELFSFCAQHHAVLLSHSGEKFSLPEKFVPFADKYPNVNIITAHIGCGSDGQLDHQLNAVASARNGNIYTDASSVKSILNHIIEYAVTKVTSEKILFGSDTPLHHAAMMKARIDCADITSADRANILTNTALHLLPKLQNMK